MVNRFWQPFDTETLLAVLLIGAAFAAAGLCWLIDQANKRGVK